MDETNTDTMNNELEINENANVDKTTRIQYIKSRLSELPKGTLVYKKINGKEQPYLQYTENGKTKSYYIKLAERERVLLEFEEKRNLQEELKLLSTYTYEMQSILRHNPYLDRQVGIGWQQFDMLREQNLLYVDKTHFIKEWWESKESASLITRPRRFGKTLMLSTVECFFSTDYAGRGDLFEGLSIWRDERYHQLQGSMPVISLTFGGMKWSGVGEKGIWQQLCYMLRSEYSRRYYLLADNRLNAKDQEAFDRMVDALAQGDVSQAVMAIHLLSELMYKYYGQRVILLIDEYDTPLQDAYLEGYFDSLVKLLKDFFNYSFKTNPYVQRVLITGITRVANNSLFSDMNHLVTSSVLTRRYADCFGFTEQEVSDILVCQNVEEFEKVREWYDGFVIGGTRGIYNPWSITNFIKDRHFKAFWVNTSGNELVSSLVAKSHNRMKQEFEILLNGGSVRKIIDETLAFQYLDYEEDAIWSIMVATGYLKVDHLSSTEPVAGDISITNHETMLMFEKIARYWFSDRNASYDDFVTALIHDHEEEMEAYLEDLLLYTTSFHDPAGRIEKEPERFYHGLVLGLIASCRNRYQIRSNRESGLGRYDIMMYPVQPGDTGKIIEFKVRNPKREKDLEDTLRNGFLQIEEKRYDAELIAAGLPRELIRKYVFAFDGKIARVAECTMGSEHLIHIS